MSSITSRTENSSRGYIGHRQPAYERLRMAAEHYAEGKPIERPTLAQVAFAHRVPLTDLLRARRAAGNGNSHGDDNGAATAEDIMRASLLKEIRAAIAALDELSSRSDRRLSEMITSLNETSSALQAHRDGLSVT
jgi:hypothetical protein